MLLTGRPAYCVAMPSVTDWISSISSLVGGIAGIGALVVSVLSYLRANKALASDARTRDAVGSTLKAVDALGQTSPFDPDTARHRHGAIDADETLINDPGFAREDAVAQEKREAYETAMEQARQKLHVADERA